jgi:hypothetical protein
MMARMHVRVSEPTAAPRERVETVLAEPEVLALQRTAGNQAVVRMLARKEPEPSRANIKTVSELGDAEKWRGDVQGGAGAKQMISELATMLQIQWIPDIKGTTPDDVNTAMRLEDAELKPGLNFVANLSQRGLGGYLYPKFTSTLNADRDAPLPRGVGVLLGKPAFEAGSKASTLAVLRHELEHAFHNSMALHCLKVWRDDSKAKAAKTPFLAWLDKLPMAPADRALVRERVPGSNINTEALANLEGFITAFPHETPGAEGGHPAFDELVDSAEHWVKADASVQRECVARLKALRARLKDTTRFDDMIRRLRAKNAAYAPYADAVVK